MTEIEKEIYIENYPKPISLQYKMIKTKIQMRIIKIMKRILVQMRVKIVKIKKQMIIIIIKKRKLYLRKTTMVFQIE